MWRNFNCNVCKTRSCTVRKLPMGILNNSKGRGSFVRNCVCSLQDKCSHFTRASALKNNISDREHWPCEFSSSPTEASLFPRKMQANSPTIFSFTRAARPRYKSRKNGEGEEGKKTKKIVIHKPGRWKLHFASENNNTELDSISSCTIYKSIALRPRILMQQLEF